MTDNVRNGGDIDPVRARIGDNVRAEMGRRRRGQNWLADVLGLSQPQVSRRLVGRIGFEARELVLVAEALEVPTSAFFQGVAAPADEVRAA
ncbi:hypothetical protein Ait01nite_031640 [Actinoplanes italicus]|uniref:BetR domain-containing protein n=1 Tax=Actinoplanes italicus TaxID=113567 RepID=A0A2T0KJB0_9ACTN|nr:helix-turn-helix domain-containing protein [Actinoplanes italicus]PRX23619.1 BetR domain-containing protein [Actinoplanes italicus]GIE30119.1 hypothetical protein Ait01nite_031640 [Actinoplanes italicus]